MADIIIRNNWDFLKAYTDARIALGRTGHSIPTNELLKFQLAHAQAKDAVYSNLDISTLQKQITEFDLPHLMLRSQAKDRDEYLKRPDLGRKLNEESFENLNIWLSNNGISTSTSSIFFNIAFCVVDGLSAQAIQTNFKPFFTDFLPLAKKEEWSLAPISIVRQGRVAIGDDIASTLKSEIVVVLIGERPGLSSPDSMGIYLTYKPLPGFTDESRNCISNIRPKGLSYEKAAKALFYLIKTSKALQLSGVNLKEDRMLES